MRYPGRREARGTGTTMALSAGDRLGRYEVLSPLGSGGMGEVYRARDTRLGRDVAIKVLPAELVLDPDRLRRFEHEARAAAALDHPNILALHDIGEHHGAPFLVTELLEGESLRSRISSGPLPAKGAVQVAVQVARGLAAAHGKRIVHRDLKPENLFLTADGHVKILDFGLASLRSDEEEAGPPSEVPTESGMTRPGTVLGTVGYMAPEQVRGLPCDHRADIFALGCVLYEMLSGQRAFVGPTPADTMSAILSKDPPPLAEAGGEIPAALRGIVNQCLEKRPEDRFSSAHDLALALEASSQPVSTTHPALPIPKRHSWSIAVGVAAAVLLAVTAALLIKVVRPGHEARGARPPKIVVLPFDNLGLPEDAYFAAGMAEEITSRLANVQGLGVISRTSAVEYDRTGKTVKQIGADLGVDYVLEGSVRWEHGEGKESRVRITPQLIRVADDTHVWADRYDRVLADVFAIQSEVAESAVKAMGVKLLPREQTALKEVSTNDLEAYNLYLQGLELFGRGSNRELIEGALQKFQAAVDRDPGFAQALALAASQHFTMYWLYYDHSQEWLAKGKELAERAVELRPDLAEPHFALAQYYYHGLQDCPRALDELATALRIQPSNSMALLFKGLVLRYQGRWVEATAAFEKGLELDPKNVHLLHHLAVCYFWARRYADADRAAALATALSPQWPWPYELRAEIQIKWHGDLDKAQAILDEATRLPGVGEELADYWQWLALLRRDYPEVLRLLDSREPRVRDDPATHSSLLLSRAQVQMLMGQGDLARRSYEAARVELEERIAQDPKAAASHGSLGIAYAGLGRRADAVREAKMGCELMPGSVNEVGKHGRLVDLAQVYTMAGQPGEAIAVLDGLLSGMGGFTVYNLRLDPTWDPLRADPRFQALLTKYEVKE